MSERKGEGVLDSPVDRPVPIIGERASILPVAVGDYLCTERDLFHVEQLGQERAVLEDCRTGHLVDVSLRELLHLRRVGES